ncbi:DUF4258 domain-containing protein [Flavobacterium salilacus subsp. salilacus]|uniref:DUF4258 domain-containing protein n=1 Tax=Flavobacterium TaxID=237 RepID=UPI0010753D31|nr:MULTISPECIES: DUF4258 domain-containing protein [Flavobacterium]KAF2518734.1 DUF4258 domain-containing protein [Flavobacterium salilacus subsp. salilacus]MBE1613700.1 DUF4258 domain-containing protein [Flavobacterium sp. SaA2.13]NDI99059.1 DUF4258 domain-containing protein [Flavobacterium salilacus subsp. altitudinum]
MNFKYRLAYFLFGLMIGVMFLMFFLGNKKTEFCYLPNCRVLKNIRSKGMTISPEAQKKLDEKWITMDDIKSCTEDGDVDFSRSKEKYKGGTIYIVEGENTKGEPIEVEFVNYENKVLLKDVKKV